MQMKTMMPLVVFVTIFSSCSSSSGPSLPIFGGQGVGGVKKEQKDGRTNATSKLGPFEDIDGAPGGEDAGVGEEEDFAKIETAGWHAALASRISNGAPYGHLICAKGQDILKFTDYDDFTDLFDVVCNNRRPNKNFADILNQSATTNVEPKVTILKLNIDKEMFVTDFIYAFAVKVSLNSPAELSGYPIYEEVSKGLKTNDSELQVTKGKEMIFPGRGVVRSIEQQYNMPMAKGAALFDKRSTLTNTYLIVEGSNDINFSAEHLIGDAEFYNASRQIIIGIKGEAPNTTYLVYLAQLVVINRFDPQRLTVAATELATLIPKAVLRAVKKK